MKRVLCVAYHFPPLKGSSGLLRTLSFCRNLPQHGWLPSVVTARPRAYPEISSELQAQVPPAVNVRRAFALDVARHLSIGGRYPDFLALPDRWWPWIIGGIWSGLRELRATGPRAVWSTYPIASAHIIGYLLHRVSGLPWVADFRDPMVERDERTGEWAPQAIVLRRVRLWVESLCARHASRVVFCTEGARRIFLERYGPDHDIRTVVIANGFDEDSFRCLEAGGHVHAPDPLARPIKLVHSGVLYPTPDRDPTTLLEALAMLKERGDLKAGELEVVLRASGSEELYEKRIRDHGVEDMVTLRPSIPYQEALREMMTSHGLLVLQGYASNPAVPAKLYEYIRAGRPILALTDEKGETAEIVRNHQLGLVANLERREDIASVLNHFLDGIRRDQFKKPSRATLDQFRRTSRARELAALLDEVSAEVTAG